MSTSAPNADGQRLKTSPPKDTASVGAGSTSPRKAVGTDAQPSSPRNRPAKESIPVADATAASPTNASSTAQSSSSGKRSQNLNRRSMPVVPQHLLESEGDEDKAPVLLTSPKRAAKRQTTRKPTEKLQQVQESLVRPAASSAPGSSTGSPEKTEEKTQGNDAERQGLERSTSADANQPEATPVKNLPGAVKQVMVKDGQSTLRKTTSVAVKPPPAAEEPAPETLTGVSGLRARFSSVTTSPAAGTQGLKLGPISGRLKASTASTQPNQADPVSPRTSSTTAVTPQLSQSTPERPKAGTASTLVPATEAASPRTSAPAPVVPQFSPSIAERDQEDEASSGSAPGSPKSTPRASTAPAIGATTSSNQVPRAGHEEEHAPRAQVSTTHLAPAAQQKRTKLADRAGGGREMSRTAKIAQLQKEEKQTALDNSSSGTIRKKNLPARDYYQAAIDRCASALSDLPVGPKMTLKTVLEEIIKHIPPTLKARNHELIDQSIISGVTLLGTIEALLMVEVAVYLTKTAENPLGTSRPAEIVKLLAIDIGQQAGEELIRRTKENLKLLS